MDPLSVAAIAGLVYAGKTISERSVIPTTPQPHFGNNINTPLPGNIAPLYDSLSGAYILPPQSQKQKDAVPSFGVVSPTSGRNPAGQPVYNLYDRQDVSGKMNSVQPTQKQYVGPGLGVGANIPAFGGFQQLYRPMPNNVGGYKMNTLPGRSGPAVSMVKEPGGRPHPQDARNHGLPPRSPPTRPGTRSGSGREAHGNDRSPELLAHQETDQPLPHHQARRWPLLRRRVAVHLGRAGTGQSDPQQGRSQHCQNQRRGGARGPGGPVRGWLRDCAHQHSPRREPRAEGAGRQSRKNERSR